MRIQMHGFSPDAGGQLNSSRAGLLTYGSDAGGPFPPVRAVVRPMACRLQWRDRGGLSPLFPLLSEGLPSQAQDIWFRIRIYVRFSDDSNLDNDRASIYRKPITPIVIVELAGMPAPRRMRGQTATLGIIQLWAKHALRILPLLHKFRYAMMRRDLRMMETAKANPRVLGRRLGYGVRSWCALRLDQLLDSHVGLVSLACR